MRPEAKLQGEIERFLRGKGWFVKSTNGNIYQAGFPDLFCCHISFSTRWVEIKLPNMKGSKFTGAQLQTFPLMCANGAGVWIMTAATEHEYEVLFRKPNWSHYLEVWK